MKVGVPCAVNYRMKYFYVDRMFCYFCHLVERRFMSGSIAL